MQKKHFLIFLGIILMGIGVLMAMGFGSREGLLSSAVVNNTPVSLVCMNGMTNYPACDNNLCQEGYNIVNGRCTSDCRVLYSAGQMSPDGSQTNTDFDLVFTNAALKQRYTLSMSTVRFIYDRANAQIQGQFDIAGRTYQCAPFALNPEQTVDFGTVCDPETDKKTSCDDPINEYSVEPTCTSGFYTYTLRRCIRELVVSGTVSNSTGKTGEPVIFTVTPTGGNGVYTYTWSGTDAVSGAGSSITKTYLTPGTKSVNVIITSGDQSKTITLSTSITVPPLSLELVSSPAATMIETGTIITYTGQISGGIPPYTYTWSGTDQLSGSTKQITKRYSTIGTKIVTLTVRSADGQTQKKSIVVRSLSPMVVSCRPSVPSAKVGSLITWTARASGGAGAYSYSWGSGGSRQSMQKRYDSIGTKSENITVMSGTLSRSATCSVVIK